MINKSTKYDRNEEREELEKKLESLFNPKKNLQKLLLERYKKLMKIR